MGNCGLGHGPVPSCSENASSYSGSEKGAHILI